LILLDTSGLLAALDASQRSHAPCRSALEAAKGPLLLSPFVLAELDYLLMRHVGAHAQAALLDELARGAYRLESFTAGDVERAGDVMRRYGDLQIGLAEASIVVLAERHGTTAVLTLDLRHFQALRVGGRKRLRIVPGEPWPEALRAGSPIVLARLSWTAAPTPSGPPQSSGQGSVCACWTAASLLGLRVLSRR
jgi:predicted nucleic acid-binding protein